MVRIKNFPTGFQQESLATLNRLLPLSYSIFALVDPSIRSKGIVLRNLDIETDREYQTRYYRHDPLEPGHFKESRETVACLDDLLTEEEIFQSVYYREFMRPHDMRYVADMFLRREEEIVAVLSLMRNRTMPNFSAAELTLLRNLQPLLEFSLNSIYTPKRADERSSLIAGFHFTTREVDVIEQIIAGAANKEIAGNLHLSLSTVKTHLQHIFEKAGVSSRTQLLARIFQTLDLS